MGGGLETAPYTRPSHPSKISVQKTICCNSTSNAPDNGRMRPKHVELRMHQQNYLIASSSQFTLFLGLYKYFSDLKINTVL